MFNRMVVNTTAYSANNRIPLEPGTKLTDNITIVSLLSDACGSALVYKATKNGVYTIVKEFFPYVSNIKLSRDINGYKVKTSSQDPERVKAFSVLLQKSFNIEIENSRQANRIGDNNTIFSFNCSDINMLVQKNEAFHGTLALYMEIETKSGWTLSDEINHLCSTNTSKDVDFNQAVLLTIKILNCLNSKHNNQSLLHLDLKPDNIYFPNELPWNETYCVFLDCGNYQSIDNVTALWGFSATKNYAAFEINQILDYLKQKQANPLNSSSNSAINKYVKFIGPQTDLFSVGIIFLQLLMGNEFDPELLKDISEDCSQKELKNTLKKPISIRLKEKPYLIERVLNILYKALYITQDYNELIENRYIRCNDFIDDLNVLLEIYEMRGIHPEIIDVNAHKEFMNVIRSAGIPVASVRTNEELIKDEALFDSRLFPEVVVANEHQQSHS